MGVERALQVREPLEEVRDVREGRGMLEKWQGGKCVCIMDGGCGGAGWVCTGECSCEGHWGRQGRGTGLAPELRGEALITPSQCPFTLGGTVLGQ